VGTKLISWKGDLFSSSSYPPVPKMFPAGPDVGDVKFYPAMRVPKNI
jgi:hypothetical protein